MKYPSTVAAVIGGDFGKIQAFYENIMRDQMLDESGAFDQFQMMKFEKDLFLLGKYFKVIYWSKELQMAWNVIKECACEAKLSYVFYRLEQYTNHNEYDSNVLTTYFDCRLHDLYQFSLERIHPKLEVLAFS